MIICPQCGNQNQDKHKFCLRCGTKLPAPTHVAPAEGTNTAPLAPPTGYAAPPPVVPAGAAAQPPMPPPGQWGAAPPAAAWSGGPPAPGPQAPAPAPQAPPAAAPSAGFGPAGNAPPAAAAALAPVICGACGTPNPPQFKFCGNCGAGLAVSAPPAAPPSPPQAGPAAPAGQAPTVAPSAVGTAAPDVASARTMFVDPAQFAGAPPPTAPAPVEHRARLVLLREDGSEGGSFGLVGTAEQIGRSKGPPFDQDAYLDPIHCELVPDEGGVRVDDLGSLNGVFFRLMERTDLFDGDIFRVGQELLAYQDIPEARALPDGTERMGSPNPGYWGRLCVLVEPGRICRAAAIAAEEFTIGREHGDLTFPEDGYVSGRHCRIYADDEGIYLEDLGSSNGTYMRARRGQLLGFGTLLLIGQQLFRVDPG